MFNLYKNELFKIFHKKTFYVIMGLLILTIVAATWLNKANGNEIYAEDTESISDLESELKSTDKNEDPTSYADLETRIEIANLEKEYQKGSWQYTLISSDVYDLLYSYNINKEDTVSKEEYDKMIERIKNGDWKSILQEKLDEINENLELEKLSQQNLEGSEQGKSTNTSPNEENLLNIRKEELEMRIAYNIPDEDSNLSNIVDKWRTTKLQYEDFTEEVGNPLIDYSTEKKNLKAEFELCEYAIKNNLKDMEIKEISDNSGNYVLATSNDTQIISANRTGYYGIFTLVLITILSVTTITEEFNKGTIKQLLTKPYRRSKILFAKILAIVTILAISLIVITFVQYIASGIFFGFNGYTKLIYTYNFSTSAVEKVNTFLYSILYTLLLLPQYLLIMAIAIMFSVLSCNSGVSIALTMIELFTYSLVNQLVLVYGKIKLLIYLETLNWDWTIFLYGKQSTIKGITFPISIIVCTVYFAVFMIVSFATFKHKEIKNI